MNYHEFNSNFRHALPQNNNQGVNNKPKAPDVYIDDNLFLNLGQKAEFHMSFPDSKSERDRVFTGIIYEATADHVVLQSEKEGAWYLLPLLYLNYIVFRKAPKAPDLAKWHGN